MTPTWITYRPRGNGATVRNHLVDPDQRFHNYAIVTRCDMLAHKGEWQPAIEDAKGERTEPDCKHCTNLLRLGKRGPK